MENTIDNGGMTTPNNIPVMPEKKMKRTRQRLIFYILIMLFPLAHFALFKAYLNFDMVAMALSKYVRPEGQDAYVRQFVWFENFEKVIEMMGSTSTFGHKYILMLRNSMLFYGIGLTFVPVGIFYAYYIYKGYPLGNVFRVILYLPQIVSSVVLCFLYREMMRTVVQVGGLEMGHIVLYNFWTGFGTNVIMYTGAMCGINSSISESAQLDGASSFRELWSITIPMVFPTIVTFLVMGIAGIFTLQANLYSFYGAQLYGQNEKAVAFQPIGYYMYVNSVYSSPTGVLKGNEGMMLIGYGPMTFPELSALGLMITAVVLPTALVTRHLLEKYGPSDK